MPNALVMTLYNELEHLLLCGDSTFINNGPVLLKEFLLKPGFFEGVETVPAIGKNYTRKKIIGEPNKHVIRFMEWPAGYFLLPHEHHGRPCFELLVEGLLMIDDWKVEKNSDDYYTLEKIKEYTVKPGQAGVVDPAITQVHSVLSIERSKSLHVYPLDNPRTFCYENISCNGLYKRKEFELKKD